MSIVILSNSAQADGLVASGAVARPLSQPACETASLEVPMEGAGANRSGLWECSPGRFERQLANAEVMHILSGVCTFTPTGGTPLEIRAGDTLFFPANTVGTWDIRQTIRKVYVVIG
jgi:uncharacterized cupin superfamily protein